MSDMFRLFPDVDDDDGGSFGSRKPDTPRKGHSNKRRRRVDFDTSAGRFREDNGQFHCGTTPEDFDGGVKRFRDSQGRFDDSPDDLKPSCRRKNSKPQQTPSDARWSFLGGSVTESQLTDDWGRDY